jgi:adenosylcobinamide kinase / adenosylcobinamide-phosphate guanylyltransferase
MCVDSKIVLLTGGARSGKSRYAQQLALSLSDTPVYLATAKIWDGDFEKRIIRHKQERDARWTNIEVQRTIAGLPLDGRVCIIDCVTLWLTNFFSDTHYDTDAALKLFKEQANALSNKAGTFIVVTNEIGMGVHAETEIGRKFTDLQGWANQHMAGLASEVVLMVSGIDVKIKPDAKPV